MSNNSYSLPMVGGCRCGAIRFQLTQDPMFSFACHCTDCQQLTSSAFSFGLAMPKDGYEVIQGRGVEYSKTADTGNTSRQYFCENCGSWVATRIDEKPDLVIVRPMQLDAHHWFRPIAQIFTRSALPFAQMSTALTWETEFESKEDIDAMKSAFKASNMTPPN